MPVINSRKNVEEDYRKLKWRRAYDLVFDMESHGLIASSEIHKQATDIFALGDVEFDSFKRAIERVICP